MISITMKKISPLFFILVTLLIGCSSENNSTPTTPTTPPSTTTPTKSVPILSTTAISAVTLNSATGGGTISNNGGAEVTARGIVWNTSPLPTLSSGSKTTDGTGSGSFTSSITGLLPSTTYYVRAYAINSEGTAYGNEISFLTNAVALPTLTTTAISNITDNSATSGGNITIDGGNAVTARGVVWNTSPSPTVALTTKTVDNSGIGTFSSTLSGLIPGTTYYVRAYATNTAGTAYGNEVQFSTIPLLLGGINPSVGEITDGDGNVYESVVIGTQEWLTENLKTTKYCNGESIPKVSLSQSATLTTAAWTYYDENPNNESYGKLYNWYVASSNKNACPCGWRVSNRNDWIKLANFLDKDNTSYSTAAVQIKSTGTIEDGNGLWHTSKASNIGTNSSNFNALPAGWGDGSTLKFENKNYKTAWWFSGSYNSTSGEYNQVNYNYADFYFTIIEKNSVMSIRCIKE